MIDSLQLRGTIRYSQELRQGVPRAFGMQLPGEASNWSVLISSHIPFLDLEVHLPAPCSQFETIMVIHTTAALGNALPGEKGGGSAVNWVCVVVCTTEHPVCAKSVECNIRGCEDKNCDCNCDDDSDDSCLEGTTHAHADVNN
ncbi:hypothetical protein BDV19DRAFT_311202 [Aspergillus venezuelensis]